ncbi:acetate/propionate family kinase [Burkholderia thailandensis]|uniref:acetate/propionate family kinase n=1 Tax=Burkholderia thailandensis TaxID=57975 RepID=UPI0022AC4E25|nr:acetate/propionate family kinase [Burkholderia thailandensis]MCZ2898908.1 acetate/propionate family kinase [Burkholderia thailandensis]MDD1481445.1 acetate/propionate family kinase [Burkholderia thailandensis]MDD1484888.1 acetate/propionate family kinase [Burkholderia thailandensis]MDD1491598.1 acetate/propionate family kinase [Burkholderia thailandensis]
MSEPLLLTFNAGSSTLKIGLYSVANGAPAPLGRGKIDFNRTPLQLEYSNGGDAHTVPLAASVTDDLHDVLDEALNWIGAHLPVHELVSVGHRVVHGGDAFGGPVRIDERTLDAIAALVPLAPLHQPQSVRLIRALRHLRPHLPQVASFDTAFHRTQSDLVRRFALPRALFDEGVKRYGFHGLSYRYVAGRLRERHPAVARGKVVAAHLGSGASLCALDAGVSRDTSMGFSTLDGVPMATRCGTLDAGVVLHLQKTLGYSVDDVEQMLYHRSGLLGVSGVSGDARALLADPSAGARDALALFAFRIAGEAARLATTLGGLDALVFTAGIGEHQPQTRAAVCERLCWLGVELDADANARNAEIVSSDASRVAVLVVPTDEEQVIARDAASVLHA